MSDIVAVVLAMIPVHYISVFHVFFISWWAKTESKSLVLTLLLNIGHN